MGLIRICIICMKSAQSLTLKYDDLNPCEVENDNNQEWNRYKHLHYGTECDYYTIFSL